MNGEVLHSSVAPMGFGGDVAGTAAKEKLGSPERTSRLPKWRMIIDNPNFHSPNTRSIICFNELIIDSRKSIISMDVFDYRKSINKAENR